MFQKDHVAPEYCKHAMTTLLSAALGWRKHCSGYLGGFDGANLANSSKNLSRHATSVLAPKQLSIGHKAFSKHSQFVGISVPPDGMSRPSMDRMKSTRHGAGRGVPGENRMKRTRQEPDGAGPATEPDDYTGPVRSTHRMWGHIWKYVPKSR